LVDYGARSARKDDPERTALFLVGAEDGLRQGENIAVRRGDVDLCQASVVAGFDSKSGSGPTRARTGFESSGAR
jgi:hypothetical protein